MTSVIKPEVLAKFPDWLNKLKQYGEEQYPRFIWYIWLGFFGIATLINVCSISWAWYRRRSPHRSTSSTQNGGTSLKRLPSAVLTASRIVAYRWRLPAVNMTFLEILLTCCYIIVLFSFEFLNTQGLVIRYYANRAGHIAGVQFPLIVALSSKNNMVQLFTGISHEKLNLLHRMTSRVTLVMVWVHWWAKHTQAFDYLEEAWKACGFVAGIVMSIIVLISLQPIRKRFYEFFYLTHVLLVMILLILSIIHCVYASPPVPQYIYPCFIVWGLDRTVRLIRYLVVNNFVRHKGTAGELELLNHDALRLTIKRRVPWGWRAGQHAFLAFPTINPTQSHPFTVATIPDDNKETKESELVFIIRVRQGFTKWLRDHVHSDGTCQLPVFLDGPYGAPPDITPYNTCIFLAGGSGVSYTLPRLQEIIRQVSKNEACARRVSFVWVVRDRSHIRWISSRLTSILSAIPSTSSLDLSVSIFVTSSAGEEYAGSSDSSRSSKSDLEKRPNNVIDEKDGLDAEINALEALGVQVSTGRPNIPEILEAEVGKSDGAVSVDVSGPDPLVSTVRSSLSSSFAGPLNVLKGGPTIQLNVESFTM